MAEAINLCISRNGSGGDRVPQPGSRISELFRCRIAGRIVKAQHLVLTRYTLKRRGWSYRHFSPEWMEERLRLFRTFCVPGMEQQTRTDYSSWLIFCDESTDPPEVEKVERAVAEVPGAAVAITSLERGIGIQETVATVVDDDADVLVTTLLDSDDCFHSEMIATVRSYAEAFAESGDRRLFVNFPCGYRYDETTARLYATTWLYGPFSSLFERLGPNGTKIRTVNSGNHNRFHHSTTMHFDYSLPAWIQVIHGQAESTAPLRGDVLTGGNKQSVVLHTDIEVDLAEVRDGFGADLGRPVDAAA
jgi:Putative rhamnosyl transferase